MSDIKKFLQIMDESTVAGCVAPVAGAVGGTQTRPKDSIFAFEETTITNGGPEKAPAVKGPMYEWGNWSAKQTKVKKPKSNKE